MADFYITEELIPIINNITRYGLYPNLKVEGKEMQLEWDLIKFYCLYYEINFQFDSTNYSDFDNETLPDVRKNVISNFPDFGLYKTQLEINDLSNMSDVGIGDAIDDLSDIIRDLLEIKWRIENNSLADGLWYFKLIFPGHTQQHILDLLNYMKEKDSNNLQ